MFSGIVEAQGELIAFRAEDQSAQVEIKIPNNFNDLRIGDSLSVNGVCLTIEDLRSNSVIATLGPETLKITHWNEARMKNKPLNLERSLKADDRVHGHFVQGHVDAMGEILSTRDKGDSMILRIGFPKFMAPYIWKKGSVSINGVSLTVNLVRSEAMEVCLIPETLRRTNLASVKVGDIVTLEADMSARALVHQQQHKFTPGDEGKNELGS